MFWVVIYTIKFKSYSNIFSLSELLNNYQIIDPGTKLARHYLMGIEPNPQKIPQNSGKQIRIPEGKKILPKNWQNV